MNVNGTTLDVFVCHVMQGQSDKALMTAGPMKSAAAAVWACNELVWPTLEVLQDLYAAHHVSRGGYHSSIRILAAVAAKAVLRLAPTGASDRSMMVLTVPGEREEFGADLIAHLAEAHGWAVYFAGAGAIHEEIIFALGRLSPDAIVIHAGLLGSQPAVTGLVRHLRSAGIWPMSQLCVCGRVVAGFTQRPSDPRADILGHTPIELLELMGLCPDFRAAPNDCAATLLPMPVNSVPKCGHAPSPAISPPQPASETISRVIYRRLAGRWGDGDSN